jgi:translation initiation factor 5
LVSGEKEEKAFLGGLERLVGVLHTKLLPKVSLLLKEAYDLDLLSDEVILAWAKKNSKKYVSKEVNKEVRKKAEPFVQWIETAEEEDSTEEE